MRPGYRARWLQALLVAILVTAPICHASTPVERRWENADLIIEGRIIETKTENGVPVSMIAVDRILKSETIACEQYTKGYVEGLILQVPANSLSQHQTHRLFLEEAQDTYKIIAVEIMENEHHSYLIDPGSTGLLMLITMTLAVSQRQLLTKDKKE